MSSPSVLFLRSNPIDPDPRVEKEARALVSAGYRVSVLGWDRTAALPLREEKDGYVIHRLPIKAKFGSGLANFPQVLRWQYHLLIWLMKYHYQYEVIHACDFDTIFPALIIKYIRHKRVVYDIFDFYADHLRRTPTLIKHLIRWMDYWAINHADAVILCDDSRKKQISQSNPRKLIVIYNSPEDLVPELENKKINPDTSLCISYVGLLQQERGIFEMLDILSRHPEWQLLLAGFGGDEQIILEKVKSLPNVSWYGRISYDRALALNAKADVLFATYDPAIENHKFASPNKIYEAMMLGKPIIVARHTNMDQIVEENQCGIVVNYGDQDNLEMAINQLADNPDLRIKLGSNGRDAYETQFSWGIMKKRLLSLYETF